MYSAEGWHFLFRFLAHKSPQTENPSLCVCDGAATRSSARGESLGYDVWRCLSCQNVSPHWTSDGVEISAI